MCPLVELWACPYRDCRTWKPLLLQAGQGHVTSVHGLCSTPWAALHALIHVILQAELRELQPVLEQTAKDVEAMMVQITADKQEADVTQKRVAKQEQEADEQAAKVCGSSGSKYVAAVAASVWQVCPQHNV